MVGNYHRGAFDVADSMLGPPEDDWWHKYVLGVAAPAAAIVYSIVQLVSQGISPWVAFVSSAALFAHVHYFWSLTPQLQRFADLVKNILAVPLICLILYGGYVLATNF